MNQPVRLVGLKDRGSERCAARRVPLVGRGDVDGGDVGAGLTAALHLFSTMNCHEPGSLDVDVTVGDEPLHELFGLE